MPKKIQKMSDRFPGYKKPKPCAKGKQIKEHARKIEKILFSRKLLRMEKTIETAIRLHCSSIENLVNAQQDLDIARELRKAAKRVANKAFEEVKDEVNR